MRRFNKHKTLLIFKNLGITAGLFFLIVVACVLGKYLIVTLVPTIKVPEVQGVPYGEIILGILAAGLVLFQLETGAEIEESQFILEQNKVFIENEKLKGVEDYLDRKNQGITSKENIDRQDFINYLVYLEGLASEEQSGIISLGEIDNVFSFRYFLALNSLEIQIKELYNDGKTNMPYYLGCIRVYTKWYNYRKSKCKNMGEEENWMPSHETKLFYISDFEKYLEKPITTGVDENGKEFAKISGHRRKDGWIEQSSSQEVEIKTRWLIKLKKDTKDNVERAVLKELVRNRGGEVIFKEIKHQVEYNNIVEYNAKFDEMIKSQRGVSKDEIS